MRHACNNLKQKTGRHWSNTRFSWRVITAQDFHSHDFKEPGVNNTGMNSTTDMEDEVRQIWSMAGQYQYTDVLVKRRGSWQAVGSHITAVGVGALRLSVGRLVRGWR